MWETLQTYSGAIVGIFTVVLVGVTVVYVFVTYRLLKQSKNALLADITLRVMETCRKEVREMREGEEVKAGIFMKGWLEGYKKIFGGIDKKLGMDITELFDVCLSTTYKEMKKDVEEAKKRKERLDEKVKKLDKELKEIKNLERPKNQ